MGFLAAISRALGVRRPARGRAAAPAPERPFFAVGDIHGALHLLEDLFAQLEAIDAAAPVICVGDYIDRGEESAAVLRLLAARGGRGAPIVCLRGNHEDMCLAFLDDPGRAGPLWLRNGGLQTLASFGVGIGGGRSLDEVRDDLAAAMGRDLIGWLRALPLSWRSGNVAVVHGGADPRRPIEAQEARHLLWGHPEFLRQPRADGVWVVHGHTIVEAPKAEAGRIAIDTGAYATGRLAAAHVTQGAVRFLSTGR